MILGHWHFQMTLRPHVTAGKMQPQLANYFQLLEQWFHLYLLHLTDPPPKMQSNASQSSVSNFRLGVWIQRPQKSLESNAPKRQGNQRRTRGNSDRLFPHMTLLDLEQSLPKMQKRTGKLRSWEIGKLFESTKTDGQESRPCILSNKSRTEATLNRDSRKQTEIFCVS